MINHGFPCYPLVNNRTVPASKKPDNGADMVLILAYRDGDGDDN